MRTEVIRADTIDAAAARILDELKEDTSTRSSRSRENVIYFDGWDGLGASAVLRAVAQRLATASEAPWPAGLEFDQIIHIDCSKWESRRALQRVIAEQLELPAEVMEMFDRQDEEDDFHGVAQSSRAEIPQVLEAMYQHIQMLRRRFLVIFQNGGSEEVNLANFGFPLYKYSRNKVLWTFQGRLRRTPRMKVDTAVKSTGITDLFLSASCHEQDPQELCFYLVRQESEQVAHYWNNAAGGIIDQPTLVSECFSYMLKLCCMNQNLMMDYDLATHACNYWVCDGVIQLQQGEGDVGTDDDDDDRPWRAADALSREMRLDVDYYHRNQQWFPSNLVRCANSIASMPYLTSPPYGFLMIPTGGAIPNREMFQHFDKLGVLKLSRCTFSFSSPPFLCCHSLRFLWLDHCQDQVISTDGVGKKEEEEEDIRRCFQKLWVLDVRYTCCDWILSARMMDLMTQLRELGVMGAQDWDMGQLQGRLPNIRKLRVTESSICCSSCSEDDLFSGMNKIEVLDFSGNRTMGGMERLSGGSRSSIETVIIDGCVGLQEIYFRGCARLKNLFLRGIFQELRSLDISGTAVKLLDLSAITAVNLDEVILLDCDKLCAILWPPEDKIKYQMKLCIDTTQSASPARPWEEKAKEGSITATGSSSFLVMYRSRVPSGLFNWYISVRDARLLRSLVVPFEHYAGRIYVVVEISAPIHPTVVGSKDDGIKSDIGIEQQVPVNLQQQQKPEDNAIYADIRATFKDHQQQESKGDGDAPTITQIWPCPEVPSPPSGDYYSYFHIEDQMGTNKFLRGTIAVPYFLCGRARILHVHDSLSIASLPSPSSGDRWEILRWCRVERCPNMEHVFDTPQPGGSIFWCLMTFWASQLLKARFICNWSTSAIRFEGRSFEDLELLHLDFCPRLIHVFPLCEPMEGKVMHCLETLEIVCCGDLKDVFPWHTDTVRDRGRQEEEDAITIEFPCLKRIRLLELPMLQSMCGCARMSAPMLETIKIRGCWSLTRLPSVGGSEKKVECDCEKEWWDMLEWDGEKANPKHHPSLYKPTHSRYHKKKLLRGSLLR
ncbi:uncharacterized protein LOC133887790 [Phragmites australis]|uniref:uncharacterized protein LOC133887790 n=1 Tax=Phragmites australis TaxID=29695 RepID=UPI002D78CF0A|nr:uncharacterized protein LOC133887790 [Phragmites australis]